MNWKKHLYRVGSHSDERDDLPAEADELDAFAASSRVHIEPWLSAVFQAEHLNLLLGSGFTSSIASAAGVTATGMQKVKFGTEYDEAIDRHADASAKAMNRGQANIEDQFRSSLALFEGFSVIDATKAAALRKAMSAI